MKGCSTKVTIIMLYNNVHRLNVNLFMLSVNLIPLPIKLFILVNLLD